MFKAPRSADRPGHADPTGLFTLMVMASACWVAAGQAAAQTVPDAGQILREQPVPKTSPPARPVAPTVEQAVDDAADAGPRVQVKGVRITGATLVAEDEIRQLLAPLVGAEAGMRRLQVAALRITAFYAERGYLARVILPPQELATGVVEFQVVEGRRGAVTVDRQGQRIDAAKVQAYVDRRLPANAPMDIAALGEALAIVNEQPGADVAASLLAGAEEGAVDLRLTARDRAPRAISLGLNNQSSRGVGEAQAFASVAWNNPTGRFDAATLLFSGTEGSQYLRADYGLPVGDAGTRVRVHVGTLAYKLVQASFSALEAEGTAHTLGLSGSHPLRRRAGHSLTLSGGVELKRLTDDTAAGESGRRHLSVATLGVAGERAVAGLGGDLSYGVGLTVGDVDQRNAAALAADQDPLGGRRTQGTLSKLSFTLGWRQVLASQWLVGASARGQWASGNLDSSEQFGLGGPGAVRAYPVGEASGDEGWLLSVDVSRRLGERFVVGAFVDGGEVTLHHSPAPALAASRNRYGLAGAGLALDWRLHPTAALRVQLASPIGSNPAAQASGTDADGRKTGGPRAWVGLTAQF